MLDSALKSSNIKDIDWIFVQRALDKWLARILHSWILLAVFITPIFIAPWIYGASSTRMLFFALCVCIGWLFWLSRALIAQDRITWQKSYLGLGLFFLLIVVILSVLIHGASVIELASHTSAISWLSLIGFSALVPQIRALRFARFAKAAFLGFAILFIIIAIFSIKNKQIPNFGFSKSVPNKISLTRFVEYGAKDYALLGAGLGQGTRAFWDQAESANLDAMISGLPSIGGVYSSILWDAGILLLIAFIFFTWGLAGRVLWRAKAEIPKTPLQSEKRRLLRNAQYLALGLILWLVFLYFKPISFLVLYATFILVLLIAIYAQRAFAAKHDPRNVRILQFNPNSLKLKLARFGLIGLFICFIFTARAFARPDFGSALYVWQAQRAADILKREKAFIGDPDAVKDMLSALRNNLSRFSVQDLNGIDSWLLARSLITLSAFSDDPDFWALYIQQAYDNALLKMPRNIILLTESARFYRSVDNFTRAQDLIAKALDIDKENIFARVEKAMILIAQDKKQDALDILSAYTVEYPDIAYQAASIALELNKFDEAVGYYRSAIAKNPKHLQARFELAQAYIALGRNNEAADELNELDALIAIDDIQTKQVIEELRDMVE